MSDMSDTSRETPSAISADGRINARHLSRNTAAILRQVGFDGRSFAIEHFGRVIGFLIPVGDRAPLMQRGKIVWDVPTPEPLRDLDEIEAKILRTIRAAGPCAPDQLARTKAEWEPMPMALWRLETGTAPLIVRRGGRYGLTPEGERHVDALGL